MANRGKRRIKRVLPVEKVEPTRWWQIYPRIAESAKAAFIATALFGTLALDPVIAYSLLPGIAVVGLLLIWLSKNHSRSVKGMASALFAAATALIALQAHRNEVALADRQLQINKIQIDAESAAALPRGALVMNKGGKVNSVTSIGNEYRNGGLAFNTDGGEIGDVLSVGDKMDNAPAMRSPCPNGNSPLIKGPAQIYITDSTVTGAPVIQAGKDHPTSVFARNSKFDPC